MNDPGSRAETIADMHDRTAYMEKSKQLHARTGRLIGAMNHTATETGAPAKRC